MSMNSVEEQAEIELALGGASYNSVIYRRNSNDNGDGESSGGRQEGALATSVSLSIGMGSSLLQNKQRQQEQLDSHNKAGVRGFLNKKDFEKVAEIEERLKERKELIKQVQLSQKLKQNQAAWSAKKMQDSLDDNNDEFKKALAISRSRKAELVASQKTGQVVDAGVSRRSAFIGERSKDQSFHEVTVANDDTIDHKHSTVSMRKTVTADGLIRKSRSASRSRGTPSSLGGVSKPGSKVGSRGSNDGTDLFAEAHHAVPDATAQEEKRKRQRENDKKIEEQRSKYFGANAKRDFLARFQRAARDLRVMPKVEHIPEEMNTPRHMYLRETTKLNLVPLPTILRKDKQPKGIFLAHKGLGDTRMLPVVEVLHRLPAIETVDLCDNRLTDDSLMPLMSKLVHMPSLTYLDLSFNDMDDSSVSIQEFIRAPTCFLETLLINGSDVDDYECCNLCEAMIENKSIKVLGLANNLIGNEEFKRVTKPDLWLGGNGISKMLENNSTLEELDLTYNQIRDDSAVAIGKSLRTNKSLKKLKLAYNSFGNLGTQWLGHSLKFNKCLEDVDLTSNVLGPRSVCVLANSLAFNASIHRLVLNDNVLGRVGSQAVAAAIQRSSHNDRRQKLELTFKGCDCFKEDKSVFDPGKPGGLWKVDMETPYGQMIVEECFYLATHRAGCNISKLTLAKVEIPLERAPAKMRQFDLNNFHKQSKIAAKNTISGNFKEASKALVKVLKEFRFTIPEQKAVEVVEAVQEAWQKKQTKDRTEDLHEVYLVEVFSALFIINDDDRSGTMDEDEFLQTLAHLGYKDFDRHRLHQFMAEYDRDNSGSIDGGEFAMIMVKEFCRTDVPRGQVVDASTKKPWRCPDEGAVTIEVAFEIDAPSAHDVGSDDGVMTLISGIVSAQTGEQKDVLFNQACQSPYFFLTADQAQMLFDDSIEAGLSKLPLDMIIAIMPQIVNEEQVNRFLDQNLNDDGKLALRVRMGPLYNAFVGLPTGHYFIDFSSTLHIMGAKRLAALSVNESKATRAIGANTSQKGNGSNFRNEMQGAINKQVPIAVDGQWFANPPDHGEVRFDYVSTKRPLIGTLPLSSVRLSRMVRKMDLSTVMTINNRLSEIKQTRKEHGLDHGKLHRERETTEIQTQGSGDAFDDDVGTASVASLGAASLDGGDSIASNPDVVSPVALLHQKPSKHHGAHHAHGHGHSKSGGHHKSGAKKGIEDAPAKSPVTKKLSEEQLAQLEDELQAEEEHLLEHIKVTTPLNTVAVKEQFFEYIHSCHHYTDIYPEEVQRDVSRMGYNPDPDFRPPTPPELHAGDPPPKRKMPKIYPYAFRKILELQVVMPTIYLTVEQVAEIMAFFPPEGYLRVQLILSVFSHIIDVENFGLIYDHLLNVDEQTEVLHRLGMLNIFDPMDPDREYKMDLRRWDHREMCKILVLLGAHEPGDNWVGGGEFRWGKYDEPVPGWMLPAKWAAKDESEGGSKDNGPRRDGWCRVIYTSTGDGCAADMNARRHLRRKTLSGLKQLL